MPPIRTDHRAHEALGIVTLLGGDPFVAADQAAGYGCEPFSVALRVLCYDAGAETPARELFVNVHTPTTVALDWADFLGPPILAGLAPEVGLDDVLAVEGLGEGSFLVRTTPLPIEARLEAAGEAPAAWEILVHAEHLDADRVLDVLGRALARRAPGLTARYPLTWVMPPPTEQAVEAALLRRSLHEAAYDVDSAGRFLALRDEADALLYDVVRPDERRREQFALLAPDPDRAFARTHQQLVALEERTRAAVLGEVPEPPYGAGMDVEGGDGIDDRAHFEELERPWELLAELEEARALEAVFPELPLRASVAWLRQQLGAWA